MSTILIFVALFIIYLGAGAFFVRLGSKRFKAQKPDFSKALFVVVVTSIACIGVALANQEPNTGEVELLTLIFLCVLNAGVSTVLICVRIKLSLLKSMFVWLFSLIPAISMICFVHFVVRPNIAATYVIQGNSMAPTLRGEHLQSVCTHCKGVRIEPTPRDQERAIYIFDKPGICSSCLKVTKQERIDSPVRAADRVMVNRLLTPKRWDIVVFQFNKDPNYIFTKRLVGLPGETISIKDGSIWVNGTKIPFPKELHGLEYPPDEHLDGSEQMPYKIGVDQYFFLGDFGDSSLDSRIFGPVPKSCIIGVVTVRYWPKERWAIWR